MGTLYILRHGNTFDAGDVIRRVGCRTDLALSASGTVQALAVAKGFADKGIMFERIYCSPLLRTRQTAAEVVRAQGAGSLVELPFLKEVDYGVDENQPEEVVVARLGAGALALWDAEGVVPAGWVVDVEGIRQGWRDLLAEVARTEGDVLAVTSNGIARFVLPLVDTASVGAPESLKLGTARYGVVECVPGGAVLRAWNVKA